MTPITIRPLQASDAVHVATLSGELGYPNTPGTIGARIQTIDPDDLLLVAVNAADDVLGWIHGAATRTIESGLRVEIMGLVVGARARRMGVGRRLIAEVERWATTTGAEIVVVRSNTARDEAHKFYPAVGYTRSKTQAVYEKKLG